MDNLQWLIENGGPALKLRMANEAMIYKNDFDFNKSVDELLKIEKVNTALDYFNVFKNFHSLSEQEQYGYVHNCYENCFETFMPFFINLGFRKGISIFDEKIEYMRGVYPYLTEKAVEKDESPFYGNIIMIYLLKAGYCFEDMEGYIRKRLDAIHKVTVTRGFDIYEEDIEKIRQPKKWMDKVILKDIYNPYVGELPLPLIYDTELILYYYEHTKDDVVKQKIDDIMWYILEPQYQETRGDYGWHWDFNKKTYHASSPGVALPLFCDDELGRERFDILNKLDTLSHSPVIRKSEWIGKCMEYLELYRTERGTYLFPDDFLYYFSRKPFNPNTLYSAYISEEALSVLKRNERKSFAFELYSTFFVNMINNRLQDSK